MNHLNLSQIKMLINLLKDNNLKYFENIRYKDYRIVNTNNIIFRILFNVTETIEVFKEIEKV